MLEKMVLGTILGTLHEFYSYFHNSEGFINIQGNQKQNSLSEHFKVGNVEMIFPFSRMRINDQIFLNVLTCIVDSMRLSPVALGR